MSIAITSEQLAGLRRRANGAAEHSKRHRKPGGRALERLIEQTAPAAGLRLMKVPNGAGTSKSGKFFRQPSPPDFVGCDAAGRFIVIDAKECQRVRSFPVGSRSMVSERLREKLAWWGEHGAVSGLLAHATAHDRFYWIGWHSLTGEHPSVRWENLFECGRGAIDWSLLKRYWAMQKEVAA